MRQLDFRMSRPELAGEHSIGLLMGKYQLLGVVCHKGPHHKGMSPLLTLIERKLLLHMLVFVHLQILIQEVPLTPPY